MGRNPSRKTNRQTIHHPASLNSKGILVQCEASAAVCQIFIPAYEQGISLEELHNMALALEDLWCSPRK